MSTAPEPIDPVSRYLISVGLLESEPDFRSVMQQVDTTASVRAMTIATVAVLMSIGRVRWSCVGLVVNKLAKLPDSAFSEGAVAILDGSILLFPDADAPTGLTMIGMRDMKPLTGEAPPALVASVYSLPAIWDRVAKAI